ncbi:MAG: hypothetical protein EOM05_11475 [Clostridia bacterium]|jgi:hypothetical protein|nr:hypothetical protein [Clostridia bacterium]
MMNIIFHLQQELDENRIKLRELNLTVEELTAKLENMNPTDEFYDELCKMRANRINECDIVKAAIERLSNAIDNN